MVANEFIKSIVKAMEHAKRPAKFDTQGKVDLASDDVSVNGFGAIKLPIQPAAAQKLSEIAVQAPYGQRTQTLVDTNVRDTFEIEADRVSCSEKFKDALRLALVQVADALQLDKERLRAELYKLLIYTKGGFFLPHRDSEKRKGMVATMIVVLPCKFNGGELIIHHKVNVARCTFESARKGLVAEYAAFFADCKHEVTKVKSGARVCLAFNLILQPEEKKRSVKGAPQVDAKLLLSVQDWNSSPTTKPLVFALEHQYTASGLVPSLLKGADKLLHEQLTSVGELAECELHFGQVSRHLSQHADDGSWGYQRRGYQRWSGDIADLNLGEVYDDEIFIDGWKNAGGKAVRFPALGCESSQLISATPVEDWVPTKQDYEGYTGNAGNTLDRWYHKSAIVMWPTAKRFGVLSQMGIQYAIDQYLTMAEKLKTLKGDKLAAAQQNCIHFAEAIIAHWPNRYPRSDSIRDEYESILKEFAVTLPTLGAIELVGKFLTQLALRDARLDLCKFVQVALKVFELPQLLPCLRDFVALEQKPNSYGSVLVEGLPERDSIWITKLCQLLKQRESSLVSELLGVGVSKLAEHASKLQSGQRSRSDTPTKAWSQMCRACLLAGNDQQLSRLLKLASECPKVFDLRESQVAACLELHKESLKVRGDVPLALKSWISTVQERLKQATSKKPKAPSSFSRKAPTDCSCSVCGQLTKFLQDPVQEQTSIAAPLERRGHLEMIIQREGLDVQAALDSSRRPFALRLTKTTASFQLEAKRNEADLKLLASITQL